MFEDKDLGSTLLLNPCLAQSYALTELENRFNGEMIVADAHSPFCFLLEYGAALNNVTAQYIFESDRSFYPRRALTPEDLFKHMCDYDYLNLFSTTCTCKIRLTLNKRYLVDNALSFNDFYKLVVIPKYTTFLVGRYQLGIHYPINIRINKLTNTVLATWDADDANPLLTISQNILTTTEETYSNVELLHIEIPTFQFFRSIVKEDLIAKTGFIKKYNYTNKFYAIRIWTIKDNEYIELSQALSKTVYDPTKATARLLVDSSQSQFTIDIPQIYFTNNMMGTKLYMEVYTTYGALDDDLSSIPIDALNCSFNLNLPNTSQYSKVLKAMPTINVLPMQPKLLGGSDGLSFEELRDRVVNQNFYKTVPITPSNIEKYLEDNGFGVYKYLDNITDRVYHAHRVLTDTDGMILATTNAVVNISASSVEDVSSIITNPDATYTIMPSTMYLYDDNTLIATPLTDIEINEFSTLTKTELIEKFNGSTFTTSPFHIHVLTDDRYPKAISYNLLSCSANELTFLKSNDEVAPQIVIYGVSVVHNAGGTGGYTVELVVSKSKDLELATEDQIYIYVSTYTALGHVAGIQAKYTRKEDNFLIYTFNITTDYWFNESGQLNITNFESANVVQPFMLNLEDKYYITTMVSKDFLPAGNNDIFNFVSDLEQATLDKYVVLLRQSIKLHLGHSLKDVVNNDINITHTPITYETYPVDVPMTYEQDVYKRDQDGKLTFTIENNTPVLTIEHAAGDTINNELGKPYLKYKAGTVRYDDFGDPILQKDREIIYQISIMQFDARLFVSEDPDHITFRNKLADTLEAYFTTLRAIQDQLIERTNIYFRPTRTFGTCKFSIGNSLYKRYNLAMKLSAKYYVHEYVNNDQIIKDKIKKVTIEQIHSQLNTKHISLTKLFDTIREKLSDYIVYVDILGINDTPTLQTLIVAEEDAQPILAQVLTVDRNDTILLERNIDIEFIAVDKE